MADPISLSIMLPFDKAKAVHEFLSALTMPSPQEDGTLGPPCLIQVAAPGKDPARYYITRFAFHPYGMKQEHPGKVVIEAVAEKLREGP